MNTNTAAARVALMGLDVDGVLTDGSLYFLSAGDEIKVFSSLDGHGIKMLQSAGVEVAIISGRRSQALALRAANLGIAELHMGIEDKRSCMHALLTARGLNWDQAGYMGDDVVDLPVLRACGFSATPANGHYFVKEHVLHVCSHDGGHGAVREVCELILAARGQLPAMLNAYLA